MIVHPTRIGNIFGPVINWAKSFNFEVSYNTVVQSVGTGIETRESVIVDPRLRITFTANFMGEQAEDFMAEILRRYDQSWFLPLPFRRSLAGFFNDGVVTHANMLYFPEGLPFWARVGGSVIYRTNQYRELAHITATDAVASTITLTAPMSSPELTGLCFSAIPVNFDGRSAAKMLALDVYEFSVSVDSVPMPEQFPIKEFTADASMNSVPVFVRKPNWRSGPNIEIDPAIRRLDFGFGRKYQKLLNNYVASNRKMDFQFRTATDFEYYLSFFHAMKGKRKPFWYPEWGALLDLESGTPASATIFYPSNQFLGRDYSGSRTHRNLFFQFWDGRWFARQINSFNVTLPPNSLGFTPALPQPITPERLERATWLTLNRFGTDEISFKFVTSEVGEFDMNFHVLQTAEVQ